VAPNIVTDLFHSLSQPFQLLASCGIIAATFGPLFVALVLMSHETWKRAGSLR
jgi:hypothetical protein